VREEAPCVALLFALAFLPAGPRAAAQRPTQRGITYTVDTTTDGNIVAGILDPLVLRVTWADGRGRIDVLARIERPAVRFKWLALALNPARAGDYYLFDSSQVVGVHPSTKTFTRYALSDVTYNYEGRRDGWPFFRFDPEHPDTLAGGVRPTEGTRSDFTMFWHAELMRDTSCTGPNFGKCLVREVARGRADARAAPAEQSGVLRWIGPTRALARISALDSLGGTPIRLTAIQYWRAQGSDDVAVLTVARFLTGLREIDVDPATLKLPVGYTETPPTSGGR
jgi:hypothetical protein